jgi:hypothetical protein
MFALEQIVNVTNWIHEFNPQNVNFENMSLPVNLRILDDYSKIALRDYPKQNRVINVPRESVDGKNN